MSFGEFDDIVEDMDVKEVTDELKEGLSEDKLMYRNAVFLDSCVSGVWDKEKKTLEKFLHDKYVKGSPVLDDFTLKGTNEEKAAACAKIANMVSYMTVLSMAAGAAQKGIDYAALPVDGVDKAGEDYKRKVNNFFENALRNLKVTPDYKNKVINIDKEDLWQKCLGEMQKQPKTMPADVRNCSEKVKNHIVSEPVLLANKYVQAKKEEVSASVKNRPVKSFDISSR